MKYFLVFLLLPCFVQGQQKKVYNKDSTIWLESPDSNHIKIEYIGRDTLILPPVSFAPFTSYVQVLLDTIDDHQIHHNKTLYIKTPGNLAVIDTTKYIILPVGTLGTTNLSDSIRFIDSVKTKHK